ncbi:MAG: hypothetical protein ACYC3F_14590 [Gemmatimonadaceae bacterium]
MSDSVQKGTGRTVRAGALNFADGTIQTNPFLAPCIPFLAM